MPLFFKNEFIGLFSAAFMATVQETSVSGCKCILFYLLICYLCRENRNFGNSIRNMSKFVFRVMIYLCNQLIM